MSGRTAAADPRQSIYRFRGANSTELLNRLTREYRPERLRLSENDRSVRSVVSCAKALQRGQHHPPLVAVDQALPGLVHIYSTEDDSAECTRAAQLKEDVSRPESNTVGHHARLYPGLAPAELIGSLALSFQANPVLRPDRITMMTIHAAKGKEWPTVIIIGAEDDQFPASRAPTPEDLEEGNRLLYVGAMRAQRRLAILHARQRDHRQRDPSRFLFDIPNDPAIVHWPERRRLGQPAGTAPV